MDEALVAAACGPLGAARLHLRGTVQGSAGRRPSTSSCSRTSSAASPDHALLQPAPRRPLRRERPPHRRGAVQGVRRAPCRGGRARPARGGRALHQGRLVIAGRRLRQRQPRQRGEGAGRARRARSCVTADPAGRRARTLVRARGRRLRGRMDETGAPAGWPGRSGPRIAAGRPLLGICIGYAAPVRRRARSTATPGLGVAARARAPFRARAQGARTWAGTGSGRRDPAAPRGDPRRARTSTSCTRYFPEVSAALQAERAGAHCDYGRRFPALVVRDTLSAASSTPRRARRGAAAPRELRPPRRRQREAAPARDRLPGHRSPGRPLRAAGAGPARQRDGLRRRPGGDGAPLAARGARRLHVVDLDAAFDGAPAPRRPDRARSWRRSRPSPSRWAAACATWPPSRPRSAPAPAGPCSGRRPVEPAVLRGGVRAVAGPDRRRGRRARRQGGGARAGPTCCRSRRTSWSAARRPRARRACIYTDMRRDGMRRGPNLEATAALAARGRRARSSRRAGSRSSTISSASRPAPPWPG